ncbi:OmpA family protein [Fulvivirgaceae bacterium BMA10]|uniref:OmpA family protein n=1 Tax=Splendidivirga corallicola TaxID=3051826 RepID=A0ABT8KVN6_9BACT|nr:OmpA family protein [Fulvivirgaceae bacterium BMA10]
MSKFFYFLSSMAFLCFLLMQPVYSWFPGESEVLLESDTLIAVYGKVIDAENQNPVKARFIFRKLPYGGNVGTSSVKREDGGYKLTLMKSYQYSIIIEADGYLTYNTTLETIDPDKKGSIERDFALTPVGTGKTLRLKSLIFQQSSAKITIESYDELNTIVNMMNRNPDMIIQLEGHTDNTGPAAPNLRLSQQRVESVKSYLVNRGIHKKRIKLKAFGGTMPLSRENTDEAKRINRRVEVRIIEN